MINGARTHEIAAIPPAPEVGRSLPVPGRQSGVRAAAQNDSGSLARLRRVELFSRTASGVNYVEVNGGATEYRTSQRGDFSGSVWVATALTPPGQPRGLRAISHEISGAAGRKTIYVQLRNAAGTSPVYSV